VCFRKFYAMNAYKKVQVQLYALLTVTLHRNKWLATHRKGFTDGEET